MMIIKNKYGFTLIEVVVVMAIIAVLAVLVTGAINIVRRQARNTQRINDLRTIQAALVSYQAKYHNWIEVSSGCGWNGNGDGFFNYVDGGAYPKSIMQCLIDAGILQSEVIDPTGGTNSTPTTGYSYMKYSCPGDKTYLFAKLEGGPADAETQAAIDSTCCSHCNDEDIGYGMNYVVPVD